MPAATTTSVPIDPATLILHGGTVITMDGPAATSVAIRGDRVLAAGDDAEILALADAATTVIDLQGHTVLPGLIDSHSHSISDRHLGAGGTAADAARRTAAEGWTTISDLFVRPDDLAELLALDEAGGLPIRVNVSFPVNFLTRDYGMWFTGYTPGEMLSEHVRVLGAKAFIDPTDPATMWLTDDHSNQPGFTGAGVWTQNDLDATVAELDDLGWQVAIHTGGDAAHDMVLDAFAHALDGGPNHLRHRIEHVAVLRDDQVRRMAELGIIASVQTTWFHSDWIGHPQWGGFEANLGPERIGWAGRWQDLLEAGVFVIGGTDTPWTPAVSTGGLAEAVTRVGASGMTPAPWMVAQRVDATAALRMLTADAAYGSFEEDVKGTLSPGKYADLIIVSDDPLAMPADALIDLDVLVTVVGGTTVYCAAGSEHLCP
jgi:predicted amidohydrolase YtcJ